MSHELNENVLDDPLDELFNERDNNISTKDKPIIDDKKSDQKKIEKNLDEEDLDLNQEINLDPENKTSAPAKIDSKKNNDKDNDHNIDFFKNKLEINEKRLEDNQNYSRILRKNRDSALSYVNKILDEGEIPEEQANQLISLLKSNTPREPEGLSAQDKKGDISHPFQKFFDIANHEVIQTYLDVTEDDSYRDKIQAFDAYMNDASQEELEELYKDLGNHEKKPISLLKKMLSVGQEYLDEGYEDYKKAGGFRKYSSIKKDQIEILQNKVDKLSRELSQYKPDYDKPTYNLEEASESTSRTQNSGDVMEEFFNDRDAAVKRR